MRMKIVTQNVCIESSLSLTDIFLNSQTINTFLVTPLMINTNLHAKCIPCSDSFLPKSVTQVCIFIYSPAPIFSVRHDRYVNNILRRRVDPHGRSESISQKLLYIHYTG